MAYASYTGPASASSIAAAAIPALSSAAKYQDATLTGMDDFALGKYGCVLCTVEPGHGFVGVRKPESSCKLMETSRMKKLITLLLLAVAVALGRDSVFGRDHRQHDVHR